MEQYYHVILVRRDWVTTLPVTSAERGARNAEMPPPVWSMPSAAPMPSLPLDDLAAKFDALDQHG